MKSYWTIGLVTLLIALLVVTLLQPEPVSTDQMFHEALRSLRDGEEYPQLEETFNRLKSDRNFWRHLAVLDAALFLRSGYPAEAIDRLSVVSEDNPVREEALHCAGEALYRLDKLAQAQQVFHLMRSEFPGNTDARRWLGAIYYDLGAYDQAITEMKAVAEAKPQDYRPHHLLGIMYQDFEVAEDAASHFSLALQLNPPTKIVQELSLDLARVLIDNREYARAMNQLDQVNSGAEKLELQAICFWHLGKIARAEKLLVAAEELTSLTPKAMELKAEMATANGDLESSIAILTTLVEVHPDLANARYNLAMTLRQNGNEKLAETQFARWEEDRKLAEEMVQLNLTAVSDPANSDVRFRLADICRQLGKEKLADVWQKAADACSRLQQTTDNNVLK